LTWLTIQGHAQLYLILPLSFQGYGRWTTLPTLVMLALCSLWLSSTRISKVNHL
jgi:hypothetical protein